MTMSLPVLVKTGHAWKFCANKFPFRKFFQPNAELIQICKRLYSQPASARALKNVMSAWQIHGYGEIDDLNQSSTVCVPVIQNPKDVLVEVHASSVNPFDCAMIRGYGSSTFNAIRQVGKCAGYKSLPEFPLIPGRDFSGVVMETGKDVSPMKFKPGDLVWGAGEAWRQGTHAEYATISSEQISHKPAGLSHVEAASLPYVAATTWSGLCTFGFLRPGKMVGQRVLVLGGSGGVGTFAIQLLKAWGADITTTCSTDAIELVLGLGAEIAIDYKTHDVSQELAQLNRFDVILDCTDTAPDPQQIFHLLKKYSNAKYITFTSPFLRNNDELGVPFGVFKTGVTFGLKNLKAIQEGRTIRYGLYMPSGHVMKEVAKLVDSNKITPVVEKVFTFDALPEAYHKVTGKHNRGRTVIDVRGAAPPGDNGLEDDGS